MSVENLKEYARRCAEEPELRARAKALGISDVEGHIQEAGSLGLHWTMDDMVALRKELVDAEGELEDLSEDELEQIAGGAVTATVAVAAAIIVGVAVVGVGAGAAAGAVAGGSASAAAGGGW